MCVSVSVCLRVSAMLIRTSSLSLVLTRSSQTSKWPVALVQGRHLSLLLWGRLVDTFSPCVPIKTLWCWREPAQLC